MDLRGIINQKNFIASYPGTLIRCSKYQDMFDHMDFEDYDTLKTIDTKAMKAMKRYYSLPDENIVLVEYKNVNGDKGWLLSNVDIIGLERERTYVLIYTIDLLLRANSLMKREWGREYPEREFYKMYSRKNYGKKDVFGFLRYDDVKDLVFNEFEKIIIAS